MDNVIIREWEWQLTKKGLGLDDARRLFAYFYANKGLLVARKTEHLQLAYNFLIVLFDQVGLQTNTLKMKSMVFPPQKIGSCLSKEAYCSMMDPSARGSKRGQRVRYELSQKEFLVSYVATQHVVSHTYVREEVFHPAPQKFVATF